MSKLGFSPLVVVLLVPVSCGDGTAGDDEVASSGTEAGTADGTSAAEAGTGDSGSAGDTTSTSDGDSTGSDSTGSDSTGSDSAGSDSTGSDSTGSDSTGSDSTGGSTGGNDVCDEFAVQFSPVPPNMMFVLDKSGSMSQNEWLDGNVLKTRWNSLYDVVDFVVTNFDDAVNFGVKLYPRFNAQGSSCTVNPVEVECAPMNGANVLAGIPGPNVTVQGRTPMYDGLDEALTYMNTLDPAEPRMLILVADGDVSTQCGGNNDQASVLSLVGDAWTNSNIPTYVVGIDIQGSTVDFMNDIAVAGGTAKNGNEKFYNTQDGDELQLVFQDLVNGTISCAFALDPEPAFPEFTKVIVDGTEWGQVMDCGAEDGWVYTNPNGPYDGIIMCGGACDALKVSLAANVEYHCNPG